MTAWLWKLKIAETKKHQVKLVETVGENRQMEVEVASGIKLDGGKLDTEAVRKMFLTGGSPTAPHLKRKRLELSSCSGTLSPAMGTTSSMATTTVETLYQMALII
ncbi:hypothetical protein NL676_023785 [Syzygium grande]|nr:hypothetical protein NL676_023785 [Syzygium grande]